MIDLSTWRSLFGSGVHLQDLFGFHFLAIGNLADKGFVRFGGLFLEFRFFFSIQEFRDIEIVERLWSFSRFLQRASALDGCCGLISEGRKGWLVDRNGERDFTETYLVAVTERPPLVRLETLSVDVGSNGAFQIERAKAIVIAQKQAMSAADRATLGADLALFVSTHQIVTRMNRGRSSGVASLRHDQCDGH